MYDLKSFYIIYCINVHCKNSIFHSEHKYFVPFQADSLLSAYRCPACGKALLSGMDIELEQIAAEAKIKLSDSEPALKQLMWLN
jgi:hypothetical protein